MTEEPSIEFTADHLLSKWGFEDGEALVELLDSEGFNRWGGESENWWKFTRLVLCEAVERFVCPQIENAIKPYRMVTSHNPARVYEVDGCHMGDWTDPPILRPQEVSVPVRQILDLARQLQTEEPDPMKRSPETQAIFRDRGWD